MGDHDVWVEALVPPGSEPTASLKQSAERVLEAFDTAQVLVTDLAVKFVGAMD